MAFICWTSNIMLCLILTTMNWSMAEGRSNQPYHVETNEITAFDMDERALSTPVCGERAVCGYVQANAKGINKQRLCACPGDVKCPMLWDEDDGHSVTQGSDQYKFCGKVAPLATCESGYTAYKSRTIFSKESGEKLNQLDHVECLCPNHHTYEMANQHFGDLNAEKEVMDVSYTCAPLPICQVGDICKMVSETPETFLVNRKCQCPSGLRCPTMSTNNIGESIPMGAGFIHPIRCQH